MIYRQLIKLPLLIVSLLCTSALADVPLTSNQLHATLGIVTNFILSDENIRFHGKSYAPVTSPHTGRVWLDRNIGASKKCTSYDHALCYGDLFQWGRAYDGHESSIDSTTILASNINNTGAEFIRGAFDWASTDVNYGNSRATNWLKTDGSSVCPVGYRIPLRSELDAEVGNISNKETAYTNFLKFPAAGYRRFDNANYNSVGTWGTVWSVESTLNRASYFRFWSVSNWNDSGERAYGLSVRCIKHEGKPLIYHNTTTYGIVVSPHTGEWWLDRNLGADKVCTSFDDTACYGDYYQWGRNFDGHENFNSATTAVLATNINNAGTAFITNLGGNGDWTNVDNAGTLRSTNWDKHDGSSVCPKGFSVPTYAQLEADTLLVGVNNRIDAFNSFLKIPSSGFKRRQNGQRINAGLTANYYTQSSVGAYSEFIGFMQTSTSSGHSNRGQGYSVRCIVSP